MKVRELIQKLQGFDSERDVVIYNESVDAELALDDVVERKVEVRYDTATRKTIYEKCVVLS